MQSFSQVDSVIAGAVGDARRQPHLVTALPGRAPAQAPARARVRQRGPGRARAGCVRLYRGALRPAPRLRRLARPPAAPAGGAAGGRQARRPAAREPLVPRRLRRGAGAQRALHRHPGRRHRGGRPHAGRGPRRVGGRRQGQLLHRRLRGAPAAHAPARRAAARGRRVRRRRRPARRRPGGRGVADDDAPLLPQQRRPRPLRGPAGEAGAAHRRGDVAPLPVRRHARVLRARERDRPAVRRRGLRDGARAGAGGRAACPRVPRPARESRSALGRVPALPQGGQNVRRAALALTALLALSAAFAGKGDDTLNVAFERTMLALATYATAGRLALIVAHNVADTLVYRDPETGEFLPHLATAWRAVDDRTFEFDLRTDVRFHNGDAFG